MSRRPIKTLLQDIFDYGSEARELVGDRDADAVLAERMREHAVLRTVQIVGEASAQILQARSQGIEGLELREATGLRNILVHGYAKARMERIIVTVRQDLPVLLEGVSKVLATGEEFE